MQLLHTYHNLALTNDMLIAAGGNDPAIAPAPLEELQVEAEECRTQAAQLRQALVRRAEEAVCLKRVYRK